jgi:hypothetical protein
MKLEIKVMLALAVACLLAMVYALIRGELWPALVCALFAVALVDNYRRDKRGLRR